MKAQDLKNSILQLAIQGKLVPQDANDEPAEVLYAKIQAEKQKLIKEGKIKKDKPLPPIADDEIPFEIPSTWKWVRLGDVVKYNMGKTPSRNDYELWGSDYPWVSIADLVDGKVITTTKEQISQKSYDDVFKKRIIPTGTLLMSFKLTIGKVSILGFDGFHNEAIISILPYVDIEKITTMYLFKLLPYLTIFSTEAKTAVKGVTLNSDSLNKLLIPLPPLAEQKRIVAKIEELEPFVKQYDKAETELSALNGSFPEQLKKSILQYAIQGKLVAQDANDESAEALYAKIQAEKQKLIKEGKIKKDKPLPPITDDEVPFAIPSTWKWVRLGDIGESRIGLTYHPEDISDDGMIVLRSSNIQNNKLSFNDVVRVKAAVPNNLLVNTGDIIICARNGSKALVGKSAIIQDIKEPMTFGAFMAIYKSPINEYIKIYLDSPLFKKTLDAVNTVTINQITQKNLNNAIIPLPPLAEQKRIVAKVNDLMQYCEELKCHK